MSYPKEALDHALRSFLDPTLRFLSMKSGLSFMRTHANDLSKISEVAYFTLLVYDSSIEYKISLYSSRDCISGI